MGNKDSRVLVTDANSRGALTVLRSLGKRDINTTLLAQKGLALPIFSRYPSEQVICPSSKEDRHCFVSSLLKLVKTGKFSTIIPLGDDSLLPISENRNELDSYVNLVLPSHNSVVATLDKSQTLKVADNMGVPTPLTFYVNDGEHLKDLSSDISYPAVIKPKFSFTWETNGKAHYSRPVYVNSALELVAMYKLIDKKFPAPLIQEYVPGYNISVALLFDHGSLKAACCIKVYRTIPVTGGNSVLRESIPLDPILLNYSVKMLSNLNWHGVAEVEFRVDARDKIPKLMEINPRLWGSMDVAIGSGVDFPYLLFLLSSEGKVDSVFNYKTGVKFRWLTGDFQNLYSILKCKQSPISRGQVSKVTSILHFLKFYEKDLYYDSFHFSDPLPFLFDQTMPFFINQTFIFFSAIKNSKKFFRTFFY